VATSVHYTPEWFTVGYSDQLLAASQLEASEQAPNMFGIASFNKRLPRSSEFWYLAYEAGGGTPISSHLDAVMAIYHELLVIATGVQMAGPHLTPQSFAAALRSTEFPNPGADGAPSYQAAAGLDGSTAFQRSYAEWWFDPSGAQYAQEQRYDLQFCYVQLGRRWTLDHWPAADAFKAGAGCR
jgi:hypothetical protein